MFPSSALACGAALALYALLIVVVPLLHAPAPPIVAPYPPEVFEVFNIEDSRPPAPRARERLPRAETAPSEPFIDVALGTVTPVADTGAEDPLPFAGDGNASAGPGSLPVDGSGAGSTPAEPPIAVYWEEGPEVLREVKPVYSHLAQDARVEGMVIVRALVGVDGRVERAEIVKSIPLLDASAIEAAMKWRFQPARVSGRPVRVWVAIPMRFRLH
jgi:protein TonB